MVCRSAEAAAIVEELGLEPHVEGGFYLRTFESPEDGSGTAIYYLLEGPERARWHRVAVNELWHHYAGAPLELSVVEAGSDTLQHHVLGKDLKAGERPQVRVPPNAWQCARVLGDWSLVGCTCTPGFTWEVFELAPDDEWEPPYQRE